ncbi:MAG: NAD(P)-binding protein [Bacillota bacterium]|nr:NAD(P)-binding protein [Bacillota bacterium]
MDSFRSHVLVCAGAGCVSSGCKAVEQALLDAIKANQLDKEVRVVETGCMGPCDMGPVIVIYPEGVFYRKLKPEDAKEIVETHLLKGRVVQRLLYESPETGVTVPELAEIDFFGKQTRVALRNTGVINPEVIEEYIARDGYMALAKVLIKMTPAQVIDEVKKSGLRGRGGAGFPTGFKWELTAKTAATPKYVVCNADEGDPGAFMDRSVLEGDPHSVIEAMAIAGYAIGGANQGYVYVRAEYPLAVERLGIALEQARQYGLLGKNILGTGFDFDIEIRVGAGAFVCGEETALFASIEGRRGEPRPKPPFPSEAGLWGKPTLNNNVETYANIAPIILKGAEWFAAMGSGKSRGTKVFALAGKVRNTGLAEVPMGMSLGELIFDIGGGVPNGKKYKAAQTGGPSGGCIPAQFLNTPIEYETLTQIGAIMGSGGLIVMDEDTCMVDLAKFFIEFCQDESCGKCAPCRIGTKRMLEILQRITEGKGEEGDVEKLIELSNQIRNSSLCGLGQTAPNPVLSTIKYFRDEYDAHIRDKKCPASVCAPLFDSPCQNTCPAGVDTPIYIDHIRNKRFGEAYLEVRRNNPFPVVCGRVCDHPCEAKCRRGQLDQPVAIRALKRYASDWAMCNPEKLPAQSVKPLRGTKVAVIGSGPAGLSAAFYLQKAGHEVTVFEALPVAGGMMAVGIPEYRLPKDALAQEIGLIEALGVKIKLNTRIGKDICMEQIRKQFDAVYVAIGSHGNQKLGVEGEDLEGTIPGVTFLREVSLGKAQQFAGKKVVVVGGGNVAIDAARTSLRLGAESVTIVYRRRQEDMPAMIEEIEEAEKEGVKIACLENPSRILGKDGKVTGVELVSQSLGDFDSSARRRPVPISGSEHVLAADIVIPAIGQTTESEPFVGSGIEAKRGNIVADGKTGATSVAGIFAGGDCVTGPYSVIGAIAQGKQAASAIDKHLGGTGDVVEPFTGVRKLSGDLIEEERPRIDPAMLAATERAGFREVELALTEEQAIAEACRCLRCDVKE